MKVIFKDSGRWAHPTNCRHPQVEVVGGVVTEVHDEIGQFAIDHGRAELAPEPEAEPEQEQAAEAKPEAKAKGKRRSLLG